MYLVVFIIGATIGAFIDNADIMSIFIGGFSGLFLALVIKWMVKISNENTSSGRSTNMMDGCIIAIILEGIFDGL